MCFEDRYTPPRSARSWRTIEQGFPGPKSCLAREGDAPEPDWAAGRLLAHALDRPRGVTYAAATIFVLLAIPLGAIVQQTMPVTAVPLVFLAAVVGAAVFGGVGEALFASVLSYFAYAWFFGHPLRSFAIHDSREIVTVVYFLVVAIGMGGLAARLRRQLDISRVAARRATMLYDFSRRTSTATSEADTAAIVVDLVARAVGSPAALLRLEAGGEVHVAASAPPIGTLDDDLAAAATLAWRTRRRVGWSTEELADLDWLLLPLGAGEEPVGVLAVARRGGAAGLARSERLLLETLADQATVALERARFSEEMAETQRYRETERLRSALLSSVSHDLRTPLASIVGAATALQSLGDRLTSANQVSLAGTIADESRRLNRYIQNLLDMSRLDHGAVRAETEWVDLRDVAAAARSRLREAFGDRPLDQSIPEDAAFVRADAALLEQVLVNILDNAAKYGEGRVRIEAETRGEAIVLSVADEGPGVPHPRRRRIFEPFNRVDAGDRGSGGTGLGLSIARGFARAMGGDVLVRETSSGRGARFEIVLPHTERPRLDLDDGGGRGSAPDEDAA